MNCVVSWIWKWQGKTYRRKIEAMKAWKISDVENDKIDGGCPLQNTFPSQLLEEEKLLQMDAFKPRPSTVLRQEGEVKKR